MTEFLLFFIESTTPIILFLKQNKKNINCACLELLIRNIECLIYSIRKCKISVYSIETSKSYSFDL